MRRFLLWLPIALALMLSGCSLTDDKPKLSKELADKVWPASTQPERAVRACMATAIVGELWTYRLTWEGGTPDEKAAAKGALMGMLDSVRRVRTLDEAFWFETEMFYVLNSLLRQASPLVKSRILSGVASAVSGNIGALVAELRTTAAQVALTDSMIMDVSVIFEAETPDIDAAWAACEARIELNISRL